MRGRKLTLKYLLYTPYDNQEGRPYTSPGQDNRVDSGGVNMGELTRGPDMLQAALGGLAKDMLESSSRG